MTIQEFADVIQADLVLRRYPLQSNRWTASFEHAEIKDGPVLISAYGNSDNPEGAITDYVQKIKGKVLVFDAMSKEKRREFGVPGNIR